jgi:cardiolipin synthase C
MSGLRCAALACLLLLTACAHLEPRPPLPEEPALPPGDTTALDRATADTEAAHPGQAAFRLLSEGTQSFAVRTRGAQLAGRSIDVQTYIWHADLTGAYLARTLLEAADRGVKVRLLVDDMDARAKDAGFAALAAHPNISVRMFNPFVTRKGTLAYAGEGLTSFRRINHRMHNKTWIVDNRIAVAGGRNLGDEYFGASEDINFVDLDFAMVGPVVRDASASFDRYWNCPAAYPMALLDPNGVSEEALANLRGRLAEMTRDAEHSPYAQTLREDDAVKRLLAGDWQMQWTAHYQFASDDPLKATLEKGDPGKSHVIAMLGPAIRAAQSDLAIISPYFVPGDGGTHTLVERAHAGVRVRILTNSLAANDVAAVHGGYSRYRKALLGGGVQLYERKPIAGSSANSSFIGSSGASLHTKALVIDGKSLFVGSYNLDPRSTYLNCEQGVLVENAVLAGQLDAIFDQQTAGERAWQVSLDDDKLRWSDGQKTFDDDPDASLWRRFQAWFARTFHLDAQL